MNVWDFWAKYYDRLWVQWVSLAPTRRLVNGAVEERLTHKGHLSILDAGCGTGQQYGDFLSLQMGPKMSYQGVDASESMIHLAQDKYPDADFIQCDVSDFQPNQLFDIIICSHSFPYYNNGPEVLDHFHTMLAPDGLILLSQACINTVFDELILFGVKCTTGKAHYRSVLQMEMMAADLFRSMSAVRISQRLLMPSLYLFRWQK